MNELQRTEIELLAEIVGLQRSIDDVIIHDPDDLDRMECDGTINAYEAQVEVMREELAELEAELVRVQSLVAS